MASSKLFQKKYEHFIGGNWVDGSSGEMISVENPATTEEIAKISAGNSQDIEKAVKAAWKAFPAWKAFDPGARAKLMIEIGRRIEARADDFAMMISTENGKTITEAKTAEVPLCHDHFYYFGGICRALQGETIPLGDNVLDYTLREPWGVVGQIVPWNYPLLMPCWKLAPALAAGNCVVLKPAEQAPLTILELAREIQDLLPPGVLNIVTGDGPNAGAALVKHPGIRKLAFTGGADTGKLIMKSAAENLTPVSLELGGKSPLIIFPDADLSVAVPLARFGIFFNQGQDCTAASRLFVHEKIHDNFVADLKKQTQSIKVGDPLDPASEMGPVITAEAMQRVMGYIEKGQNAGATLVCGGKRFEKGALRQGYFIEPTVFTHVDHTMEIAQEEIFGPVLSVIPWKNYDELIEQANGIPYGLGAGLWTRDITTALKTAQRLEAGMIWINTYGDCPAGMPFGGYKQSGQGREVALQTLYSYTQTKNVYIKLG
ncbi:aldehyde dehydrogenase [Candidatus Acetothermia bacterium]|nr:aldehyde dehydrogenase [Candidatus Acetothermia bacterium]